MHRTLRILALTPRAYRYAFGGAEVATRRLLEALAARGHAVSVLCAPTSEPAVEGTASRRDARLRHTLEGGVDVVEVLEPELLRDPGSLHDLVGATLRERRPDVVVVVEDFHRDAGCLRFAGWLEVTLAQFDASRVVYHCHSPTALPFGPLSWDTTGASSHRIPLYGRVGAVVTCSRFLERYVRAHGVPADTVRPLGWVDAAAPDLGGNGDAVGLFNACGHKGLDLFLALARRFPSRPFLAVEGWGTDDADRARLAALPNVRVVGASRDLDPLLRRMSVVLVPSVWPEAFGLIVVDAMLRGVPVMGADCGGIPEAKLGVEYVLPVAPVTRFEVRSCVRPDSVIPPQDATPWAAVLDRLLTDRAHHRDVSTRSRRAATAYVRGLNADHHEQILLRCAP